MLSSTETVLPPTKAGLYFDPPTFDSSSSTLDSTGPRALRKHKTLPHPRNSKPSATHGSRAPHGFGLAIDTKASWSESGSQVSSAPSQARRAGGPDLPPTPPAHSRTSSSSHSVLPSSPTCVGSPEQSVSSLSATRIPGTPPNQKSPPTPDVTPPQQMRRPKGPRPLLSDRIPSKATTADSRTESFRTAREDPYSSDEDKASMLRPTLHSGRTSRNTVRPTDVRRKKPQGIGLGLGLESDDNLTPRTKQEFFTFDGEWAGGASGSEVEQEWDENLFRNVTVRKRRPKPKMVAEETPRDSATEVLEDVTVTPTNATKALRSIPLHDNQRRYSSPKTVPDRDRGKRQTSASTSEPPVNVDARRSSVMSSRSTVSTVVEAILVDATPPRRRTLRHVRKQPTLRDSAPRISPASSTAYSTGLEETARYPRPRIGVDAGHTESFASSGTVNSLASRKARREVWKNGGVPVVVIPDRRASMKPAGTPSLRSTSSRRSQRSSSLSSIPLSNQSKVKDLAPYFERPSRRGRAMSMSTSDGSLPGDQRTIDYPPIVPLRTSSLSAPTSRNNSRSNSRSNSRANSLAGSRTNSLTAASLKLHNALQEQQAQDQSPKITVEQASSIPDVEYIAAEDDHSDERQLQPAPSVESHKERDVRDHRPLLDHNGDPFFGKRLTAHNTPFSIASVETNGTHSAAEVSEAMAVNIYPHQNRSVRMVDHTSKAFDANALDREHSVGSDETGETIKTERIGTEFEKPSITATGPDGEPVTPPQPQFSMDDVDSPLRNPRAPPEPPAIKFTPATPSGLTPAAEKMKMLGNYFEADAPERRPSLVKRALSLRRSSANGVPRSPGFLARTLSLSRNIRKDTAENPDMEVGEDAVRHQYPNIDDPPPDEDRLHPFWRPASSQFEPEDDEDWVYDVQGSVDRDDHYSAGSSRPGPPRRSLSSRMKRTFAILPITNDDHYMSAGNRAPDRRTIKRTPSGNLRVMRHRDSYSSMHWGRRSSSSNRHDDDNDEAEGRPSTAPDVRPGRRAWGVEKRVDSQGRRFFPGWQDKMEQYGFQNLQRRLSEHRRQKRSDALRQKISGPREVRDGVGEVIKRNSYKGPSYQTPSGVGVGRTVSMGDMDGVERAPRVQVQV
ncbi:uncharacterized protein JN550_010801 [Neoarthrinium moseri]|uniref:uncharacterized protein n=1 Tax=Neoarthrinium moseri TaxID=1658444 RepID=UPI001FDC067C|nr:uncharacterized protein JN550_010801 [Neoarthrinium moseri]KAI1861421.1 hypothetical protein JN550_010801 [Neoarthrinium moseri]